MEVPTTFLGESKRTDIAVPVWPLVRVRESRRRACGLTRTGGPYDRQRATHDDLATSPAHRGSNGGRRFRPHMTLVLTMFAKDGISQSSDNRLSLPSGPCDDDAVKHLALVCTDGAALIGFTGLTH